jgi:NAD(P)H-dependent flavin oxidoreductase YrpB (nitropropane dioxygenase family)
MAFTNALMERFGIEVPIIQAPMLGATDGAIAVAVSQAGGLAAGGTSPELQPMLPRSERPRIGLSPSTC